MFRKILKYICLWRWEQHEIAAKYYGDLKCDNQFKKETEAADFYWKAAQYYSDDILDKVRPSNPFYKGILKL
jgi:hypothetical protein